MHKAVDLLRRITQGERIAAPKSMEVIGGGNVAMDISRSVARLQLQQHGEIRVTVTALEDRVGALVDTPASDGRFSDCVHLPDLGNHPDDQSVLQYAMGREHAAMEQYRSLADSTEAGPIKDLFKYLADEETRHEAELEKLYYEVVHSGGV